MTLELKALKRKRAGKKSLVSQKIDQIGELISGHSSTTRITDVKDKLNKVLAGIMEVHEEMVGLLDERNQVKLRDGKKT